jgi:hypothetical protein
VECRGAEGRAGESAGGAECVWCAVRRTVTVTVTVTVTCGGGTVTVTPSAWAACQWGSARLGGSLGAARAPA